MRITSSDISANAPTTKTRVSFDMSVKGEDLSD